MLLNCIFSVGDSIKKQETLGIREGGGTQVERKNKLYLLFTGVIVAASF